jgi:hypothetical protein
MMAEPCALLADICFTPYFEYTLLTPLREITVRESRRQRAEQASVACAASAQTDAAHGAASTRNDHRGGDSRAHLNHSHRVTGASSLWFAMPPS